MRDSGGAKQEPLLGRVNIQTELHPWNYLFSTKLLFKTTLEREGGGGVDGHLALVRSVKPVFILEPVEKEPNMVQKVP
ncbi:hypothetical protein Y032_0346g3144 [Ancylostoma ceylanicum]|uniref:Uncharacterized protein n=1 Tax=Ancylostoma ceylanicum TaxID=53326 RepID=A0A016RX49_9BILA|nr:hypothetical protein Y032_0346g3144 [Ancylostoma ceylanicum]